MTTMEEYPLTDTSQTGQKMKELVKEFYSDLSLFRHNGTPLNELPLEPYFDLVKKIPYREDDDDDDELITEILTRPYLLFAAPSNGWDCKKKMIAMAAWFEGQNPKIPWAFKAVSDRADQELGHVLVVAKIGGQWVEIDPTYPQNKLGMKQKWTAVETFSGLSQISGKRKARLVVLYGTGKPGPQMLSDYMQALQGHNVKVGAHLSTAAIVGIWSAIVAGAAGVTISIIGAVQSKKASERNAKTQKSNNEFTKDMYLLDKKTREEAAGSNDERNKENMKNYTQLGVFAAVVAGAFALA